MTSDYERQIRRRQVLAIAALWAATLALYGALLAWAG